MRSLQVKSLQHVAPAEQPFVSSLFHGPLAFPAAISTIVDHLPNGGITEILGGASAGKTTLTYAIVAGALRAGGFVAWIDGANAFDPRYARDAGIDVGRVLWIAPTGHLSALRATERVLDAGGFRVVVIDFGGESIQVSPRLSTAVWMRVDRAAFRRHAAIVVLDGLRAVSRFAALSLEMRAAYRIFSGEDGPCPLFEGTVSNVRIRKVGGEESDHLLTLVATKS
ncbi:MAG: DNA recombination/repair protein RecA [Dehalococcoidia bacterium]|nr:DNA recombination/repair protein RecA [Dehalococcoidia bacterium]